LDIDIKVIFCKEFLFGTSLTSADIGSVVFTPHLAELSTTAVVVRAVVFVGVVVVVAFVVVVGAVVAVAFVVVFAVVVVVAFVVVVGISVVAVSFVVVVGAVVVDAFVVVFVSQAVLAGQSQERRAALKMRPAGQGRRYATPAAHW
jgi:hypothetical protein